MRVIPLLDVTSASCHGRDGRLASAVDSFGKALALRTKIVVAHCNLVVVYIEAGDYARALPLALNCLRSAPDYSRVNELMDDLMLLTNETTPNK